MTNALKAPARQRRWSAVRWVLVSLVVIVGIATLTTYLTAPRPGGPMDPTSTSRDGTHALVSLLREDGVDVIEAPDIAAVERAARPDTLIAVLQTFRLLDEDVLQRLRDLPGDRLLVSPTSSTREALAPRLRLDRVGTIRRVRAGLRSSGSHPSRRCSVRGERQVRVGR